MSSNIVAISSAVGTLAVALAGALAEPDPVDACMDTMTTTEQALAAPPSAAFAFGMRAEGDQIYECTTSAGAPPTWTLKAPEATLLDGHGLPVGTHGAGPTWTAADGSSVAAKKIAAASRDPGAVPWLLLHATSHQGRGRMMDVEFVQRVATSGGVAPATGCDAATVGTVVRVPYRALYCFYRGERP